MRFRESLGALINQIPEGKVARIYDIAVAIGDRRAIRAIYSILHEIDGPVWRIVKDDMTVIDDRLEDEVEIEDGKARAEMFKDFKGNAILKELRKEQERMRSLVSLDDSEFNSIAGIDIAYSGDEAFVGIALFDMKGNHIEDYIHKTEIDFPYIPTYLSYREGPAMIGAVESAPFSIEAIMVDGNGILHPEHLGIASYVGIKLGIQSIGVAKSLLCGNVEWISKSKGKVMVNGKHVGYALLGGKARNPVYVSPGHMVSVEKSCEIAHGFMNHRIPEPTRRAHIIATSYAHRNG